MANEASVIEKLHGSFPVLPTPFHDDQSLDLDSLGTLIDRVLDTGITGLTLQGSSAEATYMSAEERVRALEFAVKRIDGRATLIVGVIQFGTQLAVEEGKRFRDLGADALMVTLPQYYDTPMPMVIKHFEAVRKATETPVLYYHYPSCAKLDLTPEQTGELFAKVDLCGIKNSSLDTNHTLGQIKAIDRPIQMFTGQSFDWLKCLEGGAVGAICPTAVLMPKTAQALYSAFTAGDAEGAKAAQKRFYEALPIVIPEQTEDGAAWGTPHGSVKAALASAGVIESGRIRDPQPMPTAKKLEEIAATTPKGIEI